MQESVLLWVWQFPKEPMARIHGGTRWYLLGKAKSSRSYPPPAEWALLGWQSTRTLSQAQGQETHFVGCQDWPLLPTLHLLAPFSLPAPSPFLFPDAIPSFSILLPLLVVPLQMSQKSPSRALMATGSSIGKMSSWSASPMPTPRLTPTNGSCKYLQYSYLLHTRSAGPRNFCWSPFAWSAPSPTGITVPTTSPRIRHQAEAIPPPPGLQLLAEHTERTEQWARGAWGARWELMEPEVLLSPSLFHKCSQDFRKKKKKKEYKMGDLLF